MIDLANKWKGESRHAEVTFSTRGEFKNLDLSKKVKISKIRWSGWGVVRGNLGGTRQLWWRTVQQVKRGNRSSG